MSLEVATLVVDDEADYAFAMEYHGPPITTRDLPRAVPIDVDEIPMAAVVSKVPLPDKLALPVVQPISVADINKKFSKELKLGCSEPTVSPTSVIAFEKGSSGVHSKSGSKEQAQGTETTVSPSSVKAFEDVARCNSSCVFSADELFSSPGDLDESFGTGDFSGALNEARSVGTSLDHSDELAQRTGSSSGLLEERLEEGFSGSYERSRELSGNLSKFRDEKESVDYSDLNQQDWASNESVLSVDYPSSRVSSMRNGDGNNEDVRRGPIVTFCDIESEDEGINEEPSLMEPEVVRVKREPQVKVRKGACYRCFKGSRFTEKEVCLVCDAKYCSNCVLRAMGSMPEGRKCVTCIGYPIDESKRGNLGKCSRMLKRLLNDLEVRQVMKAEKFCEVNQLPPEYICVNGRPLCHEELVILESCPNPPKKLKPGSYWYDKVSGLWGKEGQKPSQIISPHLNVGGPIMADASNGNTRVYINGREITKVELRMLQLAGVQCAGNPHFWVNEDGSYQEEGQKNTKGYIWGKAGTKLICAVLSLPVPAKSSSSPSSGEVVSNVFSRSTHDYLEQRALQKLLLIGYNGSGTSTIFKQAKILYKDVPFLKDEREHIKSLIQSNVYGYLGILLEGRERFEEEELNELKNRQSFSGSSDTGHGGDDTARTTYSICPRLKAFSDWLLKNMVSGNLEAVFPAATREYAPVVEELWSNAAIKATYKRRSELEMLPSVASYFLERAVDILQTDYEPSDLDILYAEGVMSSNGLACVDFSFPEQVHDNIDSGEQHDFLLRFQLIRVQARGFGENCKWIEMFEDVRLVIFCVALSDYDQFIIDEKGNSVNKMSLSKKFFESIITHPTFDQMDFLLLLNKFDLFEEKMEQVPLTQCEWFDDFHPVTSRNRSNSSNSSYINPSLGHLGFHYIAVKFKRLFAALTDRKLYVSLVKGLEPSSVDEALKYAREILKWDEERPNFSLSEYSMYSTEASSFSHDEN